MRIIFLAILLPVLAVEAAVVRGKITGGGDVALAGAMVSLIGRSGVLDSTLTNANGNYTFEDVTAGFRLVTASKAGYSEGSSSIRVGANQEEYIVNIRLSALPATTGFIAGTVRDSLTHIDNAVVVLTRRGTAIDTVKSNALGRFVFAGLTPGSGYSISASISGYMPGTLTALEVEAGDTTRANITLRRPPAPNASVVGKVTDSGSKAPIAGALVILRRRSGPGPGAAWQIVDSTLSAGDGDYRFSRLPASNLLSPYSVVVRREGYETFVSGSITLAAGGTAVVNAPLLKVGKGILNVFVGRDTLGRPAVAGASVTVVLEADKSQIIRGTTNASGWFRQASLPNGRWLVTVIAKGFLVEAASLIVSRDESDSVRVLLDRANEANSKSLSGIVRSENKGVAEAKVIFETSTGSFTLVEITASTGDYLFEGIPNSVAGGTLRVEMTGYRSSSFQVLLSSDPTHFNVTLSKTVSIHSMHSSFASGLRVQTYRGGTLAVEFASSPWAGRMSVFDLRGALAYSVTVPAGMTRLDLPGHAAARFLILERGGMVERLSLPSGR